MIVINSRNFDWKTAIAIISLLISLGSFYYTQKTYNMNSEAKEERIVIDSIHRCFENYPTVIKQLSDNKAVIDTYWEVILVNNGEKDASIVDLSVDNIPFRRDPAKLDYGELRRSLYESFDKPVGGPFVIKSGEPKTVYIKSALHLDQKVLDILKKKFEIGKTYNMDDVLSYLSDKGLDLFGNQVIMENGILRLRGEQKTQQVLSVTFETGKRNKLSANVGWYIILW
ncbi:MULTISPECIES: hypothetical protein [Pelosinus]|uniref:Uncharacterized protein n=1 Tax=Pelosinus fermentans B4 TaxID=1149862 RepID=I9L5S6_9FIRM|nr:MULTISPECIES: hypothetical protein [Pelosinus]EIW15714.1 hypothetical protein FB4_1403 [Pelosinus fermentans B4]EIW26596.1 hypothetical protein FA11_1600 [Pelosinus fermentans A11]